MPISNITKQLRKQERSKIDLLYSKDSSYCPACKDYFINREDKRSIENHGKCLLCYHDSDGPLNEVIDIL